MNDHHAVIVGVGLKMYMSHRDTMEWINLVRGIAKSHPAVTAGVVELFVLPSFTSIIPAHFALRDTRVAIGAQDLFWHDRGAYTGEVSGRDLAEIGCTLVEVGHAERRRIFGETEDIVSQKMLAAFRNGLTPVLCVGEPALVPSADAATECIRQLRSALDASRAENTIGHVIVAYEPQWAIGAPEPASAGYIREVVGLIRQEIDNDSALRGSRVIYGGSAGPKQLEALRGAVDGLFLGRSAHDASALKHVLDEAWHLID
ncbi:triose-phosphate isomerase family protein [Salinibacterium sp. NK8237]|uniref:triose-phosphate isomerase family protein n=1 Tax=Salinibacterium sp. NK8237 TaxID=2792038 RepID=UPI0018CF8CFD|nr:triose-phosphate isomerase family protein [Salinibacterium sp. NK8237]MBH0130203.1 triosephosphate isomerase [Salinibacterium sp. NK8237]